MKKIVLVNVLFCLLFTSSLSFAQGYAALGFLRIPTSSEMNGMGYASVAHITDNPAALTSNPAHLGMQSLSNSFFIVNENYSDWLPNLIVGSWNRTIVANAGTNLNKFYPRLPSLGIGISFSNVHMNYGRFYQFYSSGNAYDESNQLSLGLAADYYVRVSLGLTYKHVTSTLPDQPTGSERGNPSATANLYDVGLLIDVPFIELYSKAIDKPVKFSDNITPLFNFSIGISKSNLGQESVYYIDPSQSDPLPRLARAGIGFMFGLQYDHNNISWVPFSFKWTVEANDLCVKTDSMGNGTYQPGLGDIDFFREVILGKTNKETDKLKGWELNLFESFYLYGGRFTEDADRGNRNFGTNGYALSLSGILKTMALINLEMFDNNFMKYFLSHIGVKYNQSIVNTRKSILHDTQYYSLSISFNNWL